MNTRTKFVLFSTSCVDIASTEWNEGVLRQKTRTCSAVAFFWMQYDAEQVYKSDTRRTAIESRDYTMLAMFCTLEFTHRLLDWLLEEQYAETG